MSSPDVKPLRVVLPVVSSGSAISAALLLSRGEDVNSPCRALVATEDRRLTLLDLVLACSPTEATDGPSVSGADGGPSSSLTISSTTIGSARVDGSYLSALSSPPLSAPQRAISLVGALSGSSALLKGLLKVPTGSSSGGSAHVSLVETSRFQAGHTDEAGCCAFHPYPSLPYPILASLDDDGTLCVSALMPPSSSSSSSLKLLAVCRGAHTSVGSSVAWRPTIAGSDGWPVGEPSIALQLLSSGFDNRIILYDITLTGNWVASSKRKGKGKGTDRQDHDGDGDDDGDDDGGGFSILAAGSSSSKGKKGTKKASQKSSSATSSSSSAATSAAAAPVEPPLELELTGGKITMMKAWNAGKQCALVPLKETDDEEETVEAEEDGRKTETEKVKTGETGKIDDAKHEQDGAPAAMTTEATEATAEGDADVGGVSLIEPSRLVNPPFAHQVYWLPGKGKQAREGNCFSAAVGNGQIFIVNADSGSVVCRFQAHNAAATCVVPVIRADSFRLGKGVEDGDDDDADADEEEGWGRNNVALPLYLFTAGNDKRLCLCKVSTAVEPSEGSAAAVSTVVGKEKEDERKGAGSGGRKHHKPASLEGTVLWSKKHARGGINALHLLETAAPSSAEAAKKTSRLALLVADVTDRLTAYLF